MQTLTVTYKVAEKFIIPKGIDLNNKEQVLDYWVKYNVLHIELKNSEILEVCGENWIESFDYKSPSEMHEVKEEESDED